MRGYINYTDPNDTDKYLKLASKTLSYYKTNYKQDDQLNSLTSEFFYRHDDGNQQIQFESGTLSETTSTREKKLISYQTQQIIETIDRFGNRTEYEYDELSRPLLLKMSPSTEYETEVTFEYKLGDGSTTYNEVIETDEGGYKKKTKLDGVGRVLANYVQEIDDSGNAVADSFKLVSEMVYDQYGQVVESTTYDTDIEGNSISNTLMMRYDDNGRLLARVREDGLSIVNAYDDAKNIAVTYVVNVPDGSGKSEISPVYLEHMKDDGTVFKEQALYCETGVCTSSSSLSVFMESQREFDGFSQVKKQTDMNLSETEIFYDKEGRISYIQRPDGSQKHHTYDILNNVTTVAVSDDTGIEPELLGARSFNYKGLPKWQTSPAGDTYLVDYNAQDLPRNITLPTGVKINFEYVPELSTLHKKKVYDSSGILDTTYNVTYEYDKKTAQPLSIVDNLGEKTFSYYPNGLTKDESYELYSEDVIATSRYSYSLRKQLLEYEDIMGNLLVVHYNQYDQITSLDYRGITNYITYEYDDFSRLSKETRYGGIEIDYEYNFGGLISSIIHTLNDTQINEILYEYQSVNKNGKTLYTPNISKRTHTDINGNTSIEVFGLDEMNRLNDYQCTSNSAQSRCPKDEHGNIIKSLIYSFDKHSNISNISTEYIDSKGDIQTRTITFEFDDVDPVLLISYRDDKGFQSSQILYDANRSITSDADGSSLSYDLLGRLIGYNNNDNENPSITSYGYNALDQQISQTLNGGNPLYFYYSGNRKTNQALNGEIESFLPGIGKITQYTTTKEFINECSYLSDHANVINELCKINGSSYEIISNRSYAPYGDITEQAIGLDNVTPFVSSIVNQSFMGFHNQLTESSTNFQHYGHGYRQYATTAGAPRFKQYDIKASPFGPGGANGQIAFDNTHMKGDPNGDVPIPLLVAAGIGLVTGIMSATTFAVQEVNKDGAINADDIGIMLGKIVGGTLLGAATYGVGTVAAKTAAKATAKATTKVAKTGAKIATKTASYALDGMMAAAGSVITSAATEQEITATSVLTSFAVGGGVGATFDGMNLAMKKMKSAVAKPMASPKQTMCFTGETSVLVMDNKDGKRHKAIQDIKVGDLVVTGILSNTELDFDASILESKQGDSLPSKENTRYILNANVLTKSAPFENNSEPHNTKASQDLNSTSMVESKKDLPVTEGLKVIHLTYSDKINGEDFPASIELIRPYFWLKEHGDKKVGDFIRISMPELGVENVKAMISSIHSLNKTLVGYKKEDGKSMVTGKFVRYTDDVRVYRFINDDGTSEVINATPNHPFYVLNKKAFVPIGDISAQDTLISQTGKKVKLFCQNEKVSKCGTPYNSTRPVKVYNLEVENTNVYYVGKQTNILVHNTCEAGLRGGDVTLQAIGTALNFVSQKSVSGITPKRHKRLKHARKVSNMVSYISSASAFATSSLYFANVIVAEQNDGEGFISPELAYALMGVGVATLGVGVGSKALEKHSLHDGKKGGYGFSPDLDEDGLPELTSVSYSNSTSPRGASYPDAMDITGYTEAETRL